MNRQKNNRDANGRNTGIINPIVPNSAKGKMPEIFQQSIEEKKHTKAKHNHQGIVFFQVSHQQRKYSLNNCFQMKGPSFDTFLLSFNTLAANQIF